MFSPERGAAFALCSRMTRHKLMTAAQRSCLETLSRDTGEPVDESLSKAEASKRIDRLRERSPRVQGE
jgi:hypothetical protein